MEHGIWGDIIQFGGKKSTKYINIHNNADLTCTMCLFACSIVKLLFVPWYWIRTTGRELYNQQSISKVHIVIHVAEWEDYTIMQCLYYP